MNILITCSGRRVELIDAFRAALAAEALGGKVLAADATNASPSWHAADIGLTAPGVDDPSYLDWLCGQVRDHQVGLVVPATDLDLLLLAENREGIEQLGCVVHVGTAPAVRACRDKAETARRIAAAGLEPVRTLTLEQFQAQPFYPCFAKPLSGSASVGARRIETPDALAAHVETFGPGLIVQEALEGSEYTIDVYRSRDGQVRCVVPRQRLAVRSGEVEKGVTLADTELIDAALGLSAQFEGLWGVYCCQCRRSQEGKAKFFEINPRFGGGVPLSITAGADLPRYLLQEITGRAISAEMNAFTDRLLMLRYDRAIYTQVENPDDLPGADSPSFR